MTTLRRVRFNFYQTIVLFFLLDLPVFRPYFSVIIEITIFIINEKKYIQKYH